MRSWHDFFEVAVVINLRRRPDRLAAMQRRLVAHGIEAIVMPAVDGRDLRHSDHWREYCDASLQQTDDIHGDVTSSNDFYLRGGSRSGRVAYYERKIGRKALSPGSLAYLYSYRNALTLGRELGCAKFAVLDDDCLIHLRSREIAIQASLCFGRDQYIIGLGALQYNWSAPWVEWVGQNAYRCGGTAVGSHALAYSAEIVEELIEEIEYFDLPYDIGALHTVRRRHRDRCLNLYPNLFIQAAIDSEIGESNKQLIEARKLDNIYRWRLTSYE